MYISAEGSPLIYYPVGSYYETSDSTFNPNNEWGGTWVLEIAGQVHVSGASDGGSIYIQQHQHSFIQPSVSGGNHTHQLNIANSKAATSSSGVDRPISYATSGSHGYTSSSVGHSHTVTGGAVGNVKNVSVGQAGNMPPYINVYRWHRTA